ncbi:MAG: site-specific integrase [Roseibium sp.]|uniref:tyrosine-type recombinase/integrase n=1 Tax=Roseibium sp. TaxID=1936156 RepID=UPI001B27EBBF|nr:site-specific integrase [Roseibium sp.]MBO6893971.1 site-specific integrase [Roseibium sp.]MBO6932262.1 site-specific integrase [Roseibium sp.]
MPNLTKRTVAAAKPCEKQTFIWDGDLKGFGLLVLPSGVKSFVVQYRTEAGRSRRLTLGRYGALTPDAARKMAADALTLVRKGGDPVADRQALKSASTVDQLMTRYLQDHVKVHNAARTQSEVERLIEKIIRPRLGTTKVASVTRQDVTKLHKALASTPRQANFVLSVLSKAFNLAEVWGMRPEQSNPVRLVKRYKETERERFLTMEELTRLGRSLEEAETKGLPWIIKAHEDTLKHLPADEEKRRSPVNPMALAAIRLLLFTGARLSEILELKWEDVDQENGMIALPARKGDGRRAHPVSTGALAILSDLPRLRNSPYVLPRTGDPKRHISKEVLEKAWQRVRTHAGLKDVRLHDLRHTVGTFASQAGSNAFMISHLLRHSNVAITNRYVNPDSDPIRVLSETIGERIEAGLNGERQRPDAASILEEK